MGTASECFVTAVRRCTGTARRAALILTIWCKGRRGGSEVLAKKVCPGQTLFFNFLFSGASVRILNFSFFSRRHHTYHSRMVICLDHKIHYSLLSDQVLRIYKFFSGRSTESESVLCIV